MAGTSAAYMAARFDAEIMKRGEVVSVYHTSRTVTSGNPIEGAVALAGTTYAMLQETPASQDQPGALGVNPGEYLLAYFLTTTDPTLLKERGWLKSAAGEPWLMESRPMAQELEGVVVGINVFLRLHYDKPPGMS